MATVDNRLNGYSKQDGESELRDAIKPYAAEGKHSVSSIESDAIPEHYRKEAGTLSSFLIIVISGGEVREGDYLKEIYKKHTFPHVKLIFLSSERGKGGLSPKMMLKTLYDSVEFDDKRESDKILHSSIDRIFMVSDVDHYYKELVEIVNARQNPGINWIISNPCFEIWLYHSHFDYIHEALEALKNIPQSQQSSSLKAINDSLVKGGIDPRKAFDLIQTANKNARTHYKVDVNGIPELFSTNMFVLGEYLLDAIGNVEFKKWLVEKQKKINAYRKHIR